MQEQKKKLNAFGKTQIFKMELGIGEKTVKISQDSVLRLVQKFVTLL